MQHHIFFPPVFLTKKKYVPLLRTASNFSQSVATMASLSSIRFISRALASNLLKYRTATILIQQKGTSYAINNTFTIQQRNFRYVCIFTLWVVMSKLFIPILNNIHFPASMFGWNLKLLKPLLKNNLLLRNF